jgi:hypothetical protein
MLPTMVGLLPRDWIALPMLPQGGGRLVMVDPVVFQKRQ